MLVVTAGGGHCSGPVVHYITVQCITVYSVVCNTLHQTPGTRHDRWTLTRAYLDSLTRRANSLNCLTFPQSAVK